MHKRIVAERDAGAAVLIVSTELDEVSPWPTGSPCMYEGRIVGVLPPTIPEQELGLLMAGSAGDGSAGSGPGSGPDDSGGGPETPVQEPSSHD